MNVSVRKIEKEKRIIKEGDNKIKEEQKFEIREEIRDFMFILN